MEQNMFRQLSKTEALEVTMNGFFAWFLEAKEKGDTENADMNYKFFCEDLAEWMDLVTRGDR